MKKCNACQTYPVAHFESGRCWTCRGEQVALERIERDINASQGLLKKPDVSSSASKQELLDFEKEGGR